MTQEEQLKSCEVCMNRTFDPEQGIVCGLTGNKPAFEDVCPNYTEDASALEDVAKRKVEAEKPAEIHGLFAFFLYFAVPVGAIATIISFFANYNSADYAGSRCLKAFDIVYLIFYLYFAFYTIYAFIKRKPDAVFFAKYLLIVLFLSNLVVLFTGSTDNGMMNNVGRLIGSLIWSVIFYVFLSTSEDVEDRIPKKTRGVKGLNKTLFILSLVLPILLFIGGIVELYGRNGAFASAEDQIEIVCKQNKASYPEDLGDGLFTTDMRVSDKKLVMEYMFQGVSKEAFSDSQLALMGFSGEEQMKMILPSLTSEDPIFPLMVKAGYDAEWRYNDEDGNFLYSVSVPNDLIASSLKDGYSYKTPREVFDRILSAFSEELPYELEEDCKVRHIDLSDDGSTLHYDILLVNTNSSMLAGLTPSYLKEYFTELLPYIQDAPLTVAKANEKNISFDFHADSNPMWKMSARFTSNDYSVED